jgi:hypothetical protein
MKTFNKITVTVLLLASILGVHGQLSLREEEAPSEAELATMRKGDNCFGVYDMAVYNLSPLFKNSGYHESIGKYKIYFNFCNELTKKPKKCNGDGFNRNVTYAYMMKDKKCYSLTAN